MRLVALGMPDPDGTRRPSEIHQQVHFVVRPEVPLGGFTLGASRSFVSVLSAAGRPLAYGIATFRMKEPRVRGRNGHGIHGVIRKTGG